MRTKKDIKRIEFIDKLNTLWNKIKIDLGKKNIIVVTEKFGDPMVGGSVDERIGTVYRSDGSLKFTFLIDGKKSGLEFTLLREDRRPIDPNILNEIITSVFKDNGINVSNIDTVGWSITQDYFVNYVLTTD